MKLTAGPSLTLLAVAAFALAALVSPGQAVEFETVNDSGVPFTVCRVDVRKEKLRLFHRAEAGQPFKRLDRLASWLDARGSKLLFAMNAGMYHGDFSAVGVFVAEGKQLAPLNVSAGDGNFFLKPNGVFAVTDAGAQVLETSEYAALKRPVQLATQSGPLLVHRGKLHPAFKAGSDSRLFRNGVGVHSPNEAIFVMSEAPVNFHTFATLFRDRLRCPDALFLDGTICSIYAPKLGRNDFKMDLGPMIGVVE